MAASKWRGPPPRDAVGDPQNSDMLPGESDHTDIKFGCSGQRLPSRATIARKWPQLRLNRFNGKWRDDTTGARGDDVESLLSYIAEAS